MNDKALPPLMAGLDKVFVALSGGLGNQMFQYAAARALAHKHKARLILDSWSGFARDRQYRRSYELDLLPIKACLAKPLDRFPIWLYRFIYRKGRLPNSRFKRHLFGNFLVEIPIHQKKTNNESFIFYEYIEHPKQHAYHKSLWMVGYWQSAKYFAPISTLLAEELMPPQPTQANFVRLGEELQSCESVAVGLRLYEESKDPSAHAYGGVIKDVESIRTSLSELRARRPNSRIYLFCTHHSDLLQELNLPPDTVYVTHDEGYLGAIQRLWLLTRCCHHIFNNSSFYWWGAWLSAYVRTEDKQLIYASDNFINRDSLDEAWRSF